MEINNTSTIYLNNLIFQFIMTKYMSMPCTRQAKMREHNTIG